MGRPAVELAPGVFRIPTAGDFVNSFAFLEEDGSVALVDCGLKRAPARIVRALAHIGRHPTDVTRIVLTHAHSDHAGGAAEMVGATAAPGVDVHEADAGYVSAGVRPPLDATKGAARVFGRISGGGFAPAPVAETLRDGQVLDVSGGLRVVHTPGHTPGHASLLHLGTGVLITGDSIFNMASRMSWPAAAFCTSFAQSKETAARLADVDFGIAAFTHGPEIRDRARERIRAFLGARLP